MKKLVASVLFALLVTTQVHGGGSIGGGTGLIVRQDSPMISQSLFMALVQSGANEERILFNDLPARVKTVDFERKTVELAVEGQESPMVLEQEKAVEETPADQPDVQPTPTPEPQIEAPAAEEPKVEAEPAAAEPEAPETLPVVSEEAVIAAEPVAQE